MLFHPQNVLSNLFFSAQVSNCFCGCAPIIDIVYTTKMSEETVNHLAELPFHAIDEFDMNLFVQSFREGYPKVCCWFTITCSTIIDIYDVGFAGLWVDN